MPSILALAPGTPPAFRDQRILGERFVLEVRSGPNLIQPSDATRAADLLVVGGLTVDEQQQIVSTLQAYRCWQLVPVLYVLAEGRGFAVPGSYRPELDGLVRGTLASAEVQRRMAAMAHDGVAGSELVVAGTLELDPLRGLLSVAGREVPLTDRETDIMIVLLGQPNRTVQATEIIEHGWRTEADGRHLQILRRHVSNIRRKLDPTVARRSVRTVRGSGYRLDLRNVRRAG